MSGLLFPILRLFFPTMGFLFSKDALNLQTKPNKQCVWICQNEEQRQKMRKAGIL